MMNITIIRLATTSIATAPYGYINVLKIKRISR